MKSRQFFTLLCAAGLFTAASLSHAHAEDTTTLGNFQDWDAYSTGQGKEQICFVASNPKKTEPAKLKRKEPRLLVTHRPADKQIASVSAIIGAALNADVDSALKVGKESIDLAPVEDTGYPRDAANDKKAVSAMLKAKEAVVKGKLPKGVETTDTYSLAGFPEALAAIDTACKVKR